MTDELHLDPFERFHIGRNGAFIHRVNRAHADEAVEATKERWRKEVSFRAEPYPALALVEAA